MRNPFEEAKPVSKKLKILLFGPSGSGKTLAALSFPRVAVVDSESGTDLYAGRPGVPKFDILRAKALADLENAVTFIKQDNGRTYDTLVIDPISVFYDVQKQAAEKQSKHGALGYQEWGKINNRMKYLYNELTNLPVHVVVLAREAIEYATKGTNLEKVGVKPDADKALMYIFDFVIHMNPDHSGDVVKSRGATLGQGGRLNSVEWSVFEPLATLYQTGDSVVSESEETASERDANDLRDVDVARAFFNSWKDKGISQSDILAALKVSRLSEWTGGLEAANQAVDDYISAQDTPPKDTDPITGEVTDTKPDDVAETRHPPKWKAFKVLDIIRGFEPPVPNWNAERLNNTVAKLEGNLSIQDTDSDTVAAAKIMMYLATDSGTHGWLLSMDEIQRVFAVQLDRREPDAKATLDEWLKAGQTLKQAWKVLADQAMFKRGLAEDASTLGATGTDG